MIIPSQFSIIFPHFQDIEFTPLEEFEFWLDEMEEKLEATVKKPATRVEACQLLATTKV